ncbi:MAG: bifunctional alpha/beta hydrolase/OsmC family protein [Pseudomonadota bacterium]
MTSPLKITFPGSQDAELAGRLDIPTGPIRAFALFAHCFTCSKDIFAAKRIASELSAQGIAVLRFDFTGLGSSDGEFSNTNFSSNIQDLLSAVDFLRDHYEAPSILIGHSLGGAAVISAAPHIPEVKAVATIGAPADAHHVVHNFGAHLDEIETKGEAELQLAGRPFKIKKQFIDDLKKTSVTESAARMKKALMVMHAPTDATVGIENAGDIFSAAKHPKSFVSLDNADHLLTRAEDASYAATVIAAWVSRFIGGEETADINHPGGVLVSETGQGKFQNAVRAGKHHLMADEPMKVGGLDTGPGPYDYLAAALGACTSMTLRMYADFKKIDLGRVSVEVNHGKVYAEDCHDCSEDLIAKGGKIDRFERKITVEGALSDDMTAKVLEIADKCPVHRTLEKGAKVATQVTSP